MTKKKMMKVKIMNNSTFGKVFLAYFVVITCLIAFQYQTFVGIIADGGLAKGLLFYFLLNVDYLLLLIAIMYFSRGTNFFKRVIATFFIIWAIDIISFPRLSQAGLPPEMVYRTSSDAIIATAITSNGVPFTTFWWAYYLVLPVILILLAAWMLGIVELARMVRK